MAALLIPMAGVRQTPASHPQKKESESHHTQYGDITKPLGDSFFPAELSLKKHKTRELEL